MIKLATMDSNPIPIEPATETTIQSHTSVPTPLQSGVSLFQDTFKSDNDREESFEVIYQQSPSSIDASIKAPTFSEFSSSAFEALDHSPLVTESNASHIELNQSDPIPSQILFLAPDSILSTSVLNSLTSVINEPQVSVSDKIFLSRESLCRICASETVKALPLFHNEDLSLNLVEKIHRCLPIKVSDNDDLPQQICEGCAIKLEASDELISSCIAGNSKLKAMAWMWTKLEDENKSDDAGEKTSEQSGAVSDTLEMVVAKNSEPQSSDPKGIHRNKLEGKEDSVHTELVCPNDAQEKGMDELVVKLDCVSGCKQKEMGKGHVSAFPGTEGANTQSSPYPSLESSELLESSRRIWNCSECEYKASRKSSLQLHKQQKHLAEQNDSEDIQTTQFSCLQCGKYFQSQTKLQKHFISHVRSSDQSKENPQECAPYNLNISSSCSSRKQLKNVHKINQEAKHKCDICSKVYHLASSLDIHRATHSSETPYLCDICGKSFKHSSNLRCHRRSHAEEKITHPHACDLCTKSFRSKFHLSEHKNVHLHITPYSCDVCEKKFHRRIQLRQHLVIHDTESSYECPQCGACFNRRGNMTQHMKRHLEERKFKCKICKESFKTLSEVVQHRREHTQQEHVRHIKGKGDFTCTECQELFSSANELDSHLKTHSDTKYECEICNKQLSNRRTLDYHIKAFHTLERPFSCQHCSETFLSREACTVHERLHTGEKPFTCSECNMSFRCSSNLAQHMSTHRDERPWTCALCPKSFKRKGILLVHMRTHTGEKPFCCDICGRRFTQKNDMLKHQQTHSSAKQTFVCGDCNWPFHTRKELNKHRKALHSNMGQSGMTIMPATPSNSQTLLISNDLCQFPITILEEGSNNVIVHQIEELGKHPQIIELNASDSNNSQILHFTDSLLQTVTPDSQILSVQDASNQQVIDFDSEAVLPSQTDQTWLINQQK